MNEATVILDTPEKQPAIRSYNWLFDLLLVLVLIVTAWWRLTGWDWGEFTYLHPDERFLIWVTADISPVDSLSDYFDTPNSSLNPHNRGHGFYVYGTLPLFVVRYAVQAFAEAPTWEAILRFGRTFSAIADLLVVLLVYITAALLYDRRVALLSAMFSAGVVLQIQQGHFYTMDTFTTLFTMLAILFAVAIGTRRGGRSISSARSGRSLALLSALFGVALGLAVASKLNAAPVAAMLPLALLVYWLRLPDDERDVFYTRGALYLIGAALISLIVFRLAQPYAFSGPGLLGVMPNQNWVNNILEQRAQAGRNVDFPPAMQWARRPLSFSLHNMVVWGFGLPLGLLAWAGFAWATWRLLRIGRSQRDEWLAHLLIWLWTAAYFTWQSLQFNPTMRYQLPIYPTLVIFAAWAVIRLWDGGRSLHPGDIHPLSPPAVGRMARLGRPLALLLGGGVLLATWAYAQAFVQIYQRPMTRVAASRWIYQNVHAPINLQMQTPDGIENRLLPFGYEQRLLPDRPFQTIFTSQQGGELTGILLPQVKSQIAVQQPITLTIGIAPLAAPGMALVSAQQTQVLQPDSFPRGQPFQFTFDQPVRLESEQAYQLTISVDLSPLTEFNGSLTAYLEAQGQNAGLYTLTLPPSEAPSRPGGIVTRLLQPSVDSTLVQVQLDGLPEMGVLPGLQSLSLSLESDAGHDESQTSELLPLENAYSSGRLYLLTNPLPLLGGETYRLGLRLEPAAGAINLRGEGLATEGDWDDNLPVRLDGYDGYGGLYPLELTFNMYWEDNPEKQQRFERILEQADYIAISSNRQWGTLTRIPERFPMTTLYYRALLGCPAEQDIVNCYRDAEPGMFQSQLGFDLVQTFTSPPCLGGLCLNDQYAEEAFTVYDHPKVLVFKKNSDYDPQLVQQLFNTVDYDQIIRKPPLHYDSKPPLTLMLPPDRLAGQQSGGTWRELFDPQALVNRYPLLAVLAWYLAVLLLGILAYPLLRLAAPGLNDRGYPLARITGMLLLSYLTWLAGSAGLTVSRTLISVILLLLTGGSVLLVVYQRAAIAYELSTRRNYFIAVEILSLALFVAFLLVRVGNPDLWHPWKGGEKPMDFSYFNAVIRSSTFPPYDPWYAGGYLNYYYYGFVLVGTLVKFLGIAPQVAYNLILPTLFSLIGLGAFSAAWNLSSYTGARRANPVASEASKRVSPYFPALAAAAGVSLLGNLGTLRMLFHGFERLAASPEQIMDAGLLERWMWAFEGFFKALGGERLPFGVGDWYWLPSRAIPAPGDIEPITEFPYFSVLYADLHAHLLALPLTLLALGLAIGFVLGRRQWARTGGAVAWFGLAGLAIGALRPTNTWDLPTYLTLGILAVVYGTLIGGPLDLRAAWTQRSGLHTVPEKLLRLLLALAGAGLLVGLALLFFQPFVAWYALGYTKVRLWTGTTTPTIAYFIHWGLFLFLLLAWLAWETRDWLAKTPVSALRRLLPWRGVLIALLLALPLVIFALDQMGAHIAWVVVLVGLWVSLLLLRAHTDDARRIVLFLVGAGLMLTLVVELIVLEGDIGRMNTVFKFYLQVWTLFGICAAVALGWTLPALGDWRGGWNLVWQVGLTLLLGAAALYPLMATTAKIQDRMAASAPHTLDGLAYMQHAYYTDEWGTMDLSPDAQAIRWLQENVDGSPVIVEANLRALYRWGSRMSINTGLPGVVGWEWHQQQQRAVLPGALITQRILEVDDFYLTTDLGAARQFLHKYNVRYIILGQQERGHYPGPGLEKFDDAAGALWREVFRVRSPQSESSAALGDTVIYEVIVP